MGGIKPFVQQLNDISKARLTGDILFYDRHVVDQADGWVSRKGALAFTALPHMPPSSSGRKTDMAPSPPLNCRGIPESFALFFALAVNQFYTEFSGMLLDFSS